MNLELDISLVQHYKSASQIARVLTEDWVRRNAYCPNCGSKLYNFANNQPVADFFCDKCKEEFELKSKNAKDVGEKIVNGAYATMISRIKSENNPNFFFLTYDKNKLKILNFLIIPNFYFTPEIIEKRNPLSKNVRRSGWIGCNINLSKIPNVGKIFIVKQSRLISKRIVQRSWKQTLFLKNHNGECKSWIIDVLHCVEKIKSDTFSLSDIYSFEKFLKIKHPNNNFIKDKIRQQLQILRDKKIIEFLEKGKYRKLYKI